MDYFKCFFYVNCILSNIVVKSRCMVVPDGRVRKRSVLSLKPVEPTLVLSFH